MPYSQVVALEYRPLARLRVLQQALRVGAVPVVAGTVPTLDVVLFAASFVSSGR